MANLGGSQNGKVLFCCWVYGLFLLRAAATSSWLNQLAASSSLKFTWISVCPGFTVAWQAIISELLGKGQCWDAEYCSLSTSNPTSSATSRRTASSRLSPTSTQINSGQPCSRKGDRDAHLWKQCKTGSKISMKYSWESSESPHRYNNRK